MKIFTDGVHYFSTDQYIKNLKEIEINSIEEYVAAGLCWTVLIEASNFKLGRFDEITCDSNIASHCDVSVAEYEAEFRAHSGVFIDFCLDVSHLDMIYKLNDLVSFDLTYFVDDLKGSSIFASEHWPDEWTQVIKLSTHQWQDTRTLELKEDSNGKVICNFV